MWTVPLFDAAIDESEITAVSNVLRSGWLSMGETVQQFEERFAKLIGVRHAIAVSNCTAALHLANLAVGLSEGDEVICPSITFVAGANSILYTGARPVLADVFGPQDLSISATDIADKITPRTRAIQVMHYGGHAADMTAIMAIADRHGLAVIEDVAHGPGAKLPDGRALGSVGAIGCFSFFANKNMTTAEGGMITTNDDALAERMRLARGHGLTAPTISRHMGRALGYDVVALGYNYRLDEIRAALGLAQLDKLEAGNAARAKVAGWYRAALSTIAGIEIPYANPAPGAVFHIMPVLLPPGSARDRVRSLMHEQGIQTSFHYPPVHSLAFYREFYGALSLPVTDALAPRLLTLPLYPSLSEAQVGQVCAVLAAALRAAHS